MKENLYDINIAKAKLKEYMKDGIDPELWIKINNEEYMIIPLKDKISFQWIGKTEELFFDNVENLFESKLINGINLNNDWSKIEEIYYY